MSKEDNLARWEWPALDLSDRERASLESYEYQPLRSQTWLDEGNRKRDEYAGHRRLALAILEEALFCLAGSPRQIDFDEDVEEERRLAAEWFVDKGDPWEAPSFAWVCMVCGIEPWMVMDGIYRFGPLKLAVKIGYYGGGWIRQLNREG